MKNKNKKTQNSSVASQSISLLFGGLTSERKGKVKDLTRLLLELSIKSETIDAILAAVIVEALESQMHESGGAIPSPRESSLNLTKSLFEEKKKEDDDLKVEKKVQKMTQKKRTKKDTN